jgi:carbonic anhydrase
MDRFESPRRGFLRIAGTAAAVAIGATGQVSPAADEPAAVRPKGPSEALELLLAGNRRFVAGQSRRTPVTPAEFVALEKGQHPFATILGCSDSRVPTEMVFDQGLGDLFVVRLAGNVVDTDVVGSLEYAVAHLQTKLLMVLGHEGCGAVTAALAAAQDRDKEPVGIQKLVQQIDPALAGIDPNLPHARKVSMAVEANVRNSVRKILEFPGHAEARRQGLFDIVGAVYDLHTGKVRMIDG